jgi:hypothetical protein
MTRAALLILPALLLLAAPPATARQEEGAAPEGTVAADARPSPLGWELPFRPAPAGRMELRLGGGVDFLRATNVGERYTPALAFTGRLAVTDQVEVALPLLVNLSLNTPARGGVPRFVLSGGLGGVGFSNIEGFVATPLVGASLHWVGEDWVGVLSGRGATNLGAISSQLGTVTLYAAALVGRRVTERFSLSLGVSGDVTVSTRGSDFVYGLGVGSVSGHPALLLGPTARYALSEAFHLEASAGLGYRPFARATNGRALLTLTWSPQLWGGTVAGTP